MHLFTAGHLHRRRPRAARRAVRARHRQLEGGDGRGALRLTRSSFRSDFPVSCAFQVLHAHFKCFMHTSSASCRSTGRSGSAAARTARGGIPAAFGCADARAVGELQMRRAGAPMRICVPYSGEGGVATEECRRCCVCVSSGRRRGARLCVGQDCAPDGAEAGRPGAMVKKP